MTEFDDATAVRSLDRGTWSAHADPGHESINAMFGGWAAAVSVRAVVATADDEALPTAITINYLEGIVPGDDVTVRVDELGGGRSINHWRAEIRASDDDRVLTAAMAALANRRETDGNVEPTMPDAPDPESLIAFRAPGPQGERTLIRQISGLPPGTSTGTGSVHWLREASGRPLDHVLLAYLADQYAPRSFFWGPGPRPSATVTMSVYFHATPDELAGAGADYVMVEAVGTRGESSTSGQQARIWSRQGHLLATTEQLAWYR
jgi:acyl-CoA thioesterase